MSDVDDATQACVDAKKLSFLVEQPFRHYRTNYMIFLGPPEPNLCIDFDKEEWWISDEADAPTPDDIIYMDPDDVPMPIRKSVQFIAISMSELAALQNGPNPEEEWRHYHRQQNLFNTVTTTSTRPRGWDDDEDGDERPQVERLEDMDLEKYCRE